MLDAYIPQGALTAEAEDLLLRQLTDLLIRHEGQDPRNPRVRSISWVFLHRPVKTYVAGAPPTEPRYRLIASVPEGRFDDQRRQAMVEAITAAVLDAESGAHRRDSRRVWVLTVEVPDGSWGADGRINRLTDIDNFIRGDPQQTRPGTQMTTERASDTGTQC